MNDIDTICTICDASGVEYHRYGHGDHTIAGTGGIKITIPTEKTDVGVVYELLTFVAGDRRCTGYSCFWAEMGFDEQGTLLHVGAWE